MLILRTWTYAIDGACARNAGVVYHAGAKCSIVRMVDAKLAIVQFLCGWVAVVATRDLEVAS